MYLLGGNGDFYGIQKCLTNHGHLTKISDCLMALTTSIFKIYWYWGGEHYVLQIDIHNSWMM